jgi:hypothetical protein
MADHQLTQPGDGKAVKPQYAPLMCVGFGCQTFSFMRKVDDEAGIASRGAVANALSVEQNDPRLRLELSEPSCSRKTGESRSDNGIIRPLNA